MTSAPATTPDRCISDSTYLTSGSLGVGPLLSGDISPFTLTTAKAQTLQHLLNTVPSGLTRSLKLCGAPEPLPGSSSPTPALQSLHPKLCSAPHAPQLGPPRGKSLFPPSPSRCGAQRPVAQQLVCCPESEFVPGLGRHGGLAWIFAPSAAATGQCPRSTAAVQLSQGEQAMEGGCSGRSIRPLRRWDKGIR